MEEQRAFGHYLRAERELRQIPLVEVAKITKIPLHSLEMLEQGSWDDLPAEVFVRGFVVSYARCVGLSSEEARQRFREVVQNTTQAELDQEVAQQRAAHEQAQAQRPRSRALELGGRKKFGLALLVIIVFIIATITLSLLWQSGAGATGQASIQQPPAQVDLHRPG